MAATAEALVMNEAKRDLRTTNHMDPETKAVHMRLEEWARWARESEAKAWPSITLLARVIEQGTSAAGQTGKPPISMPQSVAVIDSAVCKLGAVDKCVIQTYYLKWEPIEVMARRNHMRVRQFQNVLRRARWRISGYIAAAE